MDLERLLEALSVGFSTWLISLPLPCDVMLHQWFICKWESSILLFTSLGLEVSDKTMKGPVSSVWKLFISYTMSLASNMCDWRFFVLFYFPSFFSSFFLLDVWMPCDEHCWHNYVCDGYRIASKENSLWVIMWKCALWTRCFSIDGKKSSFYFHNRTVKEESDRVLL